jgi:hypothetical protein
VRNVIHISWNFIDRRALDVKKEQQFVVYENVAKMSLNDSRLGMAKKLLNNEHVFHSLKPKSASKIQSMHPEIDYCLVYKI